MGRKAREKRERQQAKVIPLRAQPPSSEPLDVVLFVAGQPDLLGKVYAKETLEAMLPQIRAKKKVQAAWLDGDRLIARLTSAG